MSFLSREDLHAGPICSLTLVRCAHPRGGPGAEEEAGWHSIDLPINGVFVRHVRGKRVVGSPGQVLFFNRGETHRVSHPLGGGDRCLSLSVSEDVLEAAFGDYRRPAPDGFQFSWTHLAAEPKDVVMFHGLQRRLQAHRATCLETEERSLDFLRALANRLRNERGPLARRRETRRRRTEWVEAVQMLLAEEPGRERSLAELGRLLACSPYHLARIFQREVGVPIHRYALRQRLLSSLEPVADGSLRLTELAFKLRFSSHAHFTAAFRRTFGLSPSAFRTSARRATLVELRKNVKA